MRAIGRSPSNTSTRAKRADRRSILSPPREACPCSAIAESSSCCARNGFSSPNARARQLTVDEPDEEEPSSEALDLAPLEEYVQKPAESSTVVFVAAGVDRGRRLTKQLMEKAHVTEFGGLSGDPAARGAGRAAITEQINRELSERQRKIEPRILHELVERSGADVSRLRDEVDRLLLFTEGQSTVSIEDVREVAPEHAVVTNEWAVTDALSAGDAAKALRELAIKLDRGDSPHAVLGQLRWWVSSKLAEGEGGRVRPAIEALKRTDLALKSSGGDDRALLERLIVELAGTTARAGRRRVGRPAVDHAGEPADTVSRGATF